MCDYVLGIDAGGTKTLALLATLSNEIVGRGLAGPGNMHAVGFEAASRAVAEAIRSAVDSYCIEKLHISSLCIGAAGASRPDEIEAWTVWCRTQGLAQQIKVVSDAEIAVAAALDAAPGIVVIGGTGSIAFAQSADGQRFRAGGWGYIIDDGGSAYDIACQALKAVLKAYDGRGIETALTTAILSACACALPPDLVRYVYGSGVARQQLARLASVVDRVAQSGDATAQAILDHAAGDLAGLAVAAGRAAGLSGRTRCGLAGGVLLRSDRVRQTWTAQMKTLGFDPDPLVLVDEPARGALLLAARLC
ncbi:MAG: hypothetical protein JW934_14735 [Anaerolineae bacterium]|nr:hypothetical protein [Anaerolineae bacterium]